MVDFASDISICHGWNGKHYMVTYRIIKIQNGRNIAQNNGQQWRAAHSNSFVEWFESSIRLGRPVVDILMEKVFYSFNIRCNEKIQKGYRDSLSQIQSIPLWYLYVSSVNCKNLMWHRFCEQRLRIFKRYPNRIVMQSHQMYQECFDFKCTYRS